jgi:hypothetical protein
LDVESLLMMITLSETNGVYMNYEGALEAIEGRLGVVYLNHWKNTLTSTDLPVFSRPSPLVPGTMGPSAGASSCKLS